MSGVPPSPASEAGRNTFRLFLASFLVLYFEVAVIRYLSSEVRVFAYLKNLSLVAIFLGIGIGILRGSTAWRFKRAFPLLAAVFFILIAYAAPLHLSNLPFPDSDYFVWGAAGNRTSGSPLDVLTMGFRYILGVMGFLALLVAFFIALGALVGEELAGWPSLKGYGLNLFGSLAGIVAFTVVSYSGLPPVIWILAGFCLALPFFWREHWAPVVFAATTIAVGLPTPNVFWSPYYRISLRELPRPEGWPSPSAYLLSVNHDYHQKMVDLSPAFVGRHPEAEPNRDAYLTYELPFQVVPDARDVLVVGAGTGNDVAAAVRHGVGRVDAVEIDPVILEIGRRLHPERPYDSPRVRVHVEDARAYFKKAQTTYDLILFAYLDAHTLLAGHSSVRLDNYVYTVESFREARELLKPGGVMLVAFASGYSFVTERLFATLSRAMDAAPQVYATGYDSAGVVLVTGESARKPTDPRVRDVTDRIRAQAADAVPATDRWPFLYLWGRIIPFSILSILVGFVYGAFLLARRMLPLPSLKRFDVLHFFLLGAGFLLLETKAVTELSLLFGSTWVVNAVVIGSFLFMALLANALVARWKLSHRFSYGCLFFLLVLNLVFPYSLLDSLPVVPKVLAGGCVVGLPVFFSGLLFSRSLSAETRTPQMLGVNLLGAVVGGVLENLVMIGGTPILGVLAVLIYVLSAAALRLSYSGQSLIGFVGSPAIERA